MDSFLQDLKFAFRMLVKSPLVTGAALVSLAVGIGANTTIFTLVNAILLRSIPVEDPARVVALSTTEDGQQLFASISRPNFQDVRDRTEIFSDLADFLFVGANFVAEGGDPEQIGGQIVTSNFFSTLGVQAAVGNVFQPQGNDERAGSEPVMVLSHRFWTRRFGADPGVVGETVRLNGQPFTVVGVAPSGFVGTFVFANPSFWVPISMHGTFLTGEMADYYDDRRALITLAAGRLAPGVSLEQANEVLATLGAALEEEFPVDNKNRSFEAELISDAALGQGGRGNFTQMSFFLMGVVGVVLLIACANVANLLLGRAASRRREIGVRLALGAPRRRLIQQLLLESLLLAFMAGGLGLAFAHWARGALWSMRPPFLDNSPLDLSFDPAVLLFTLALTLVTGVLFGLAPAIQSSRPGIVNDLTQSSDAASGAGRVWSFRNVLVMGQVTLSLVALVCSGLFLRSLGEATRIDPGFTPERIAMMNFDVAQAGHDDPARGENFFDRILETAQNLPGVESASLATSVPLAPGGFQRTVIVEGRDEDAENNRKLVPVNTTDGHYFETVGLAMVSGRPITELDRADSVAVAVINEAMADLFWPDEDPIGQRFHFFGQEVIREVVGVARTAKWAQLGEDPQPQVYVPRRQSYVPAMTLAIRTSGDPEALLGTVRGEMQRLDPNLAITNVQTGMAALEQGLWAPRMGATLLGVLGGLALLLAAIGIYGVMAYGVNQRGREIAIRIAMGADRGDVVRLILAQGARVVAMGAGIGLVLAYLAGGAIESMLFGVDAADVRTFTVTLGMLFLVAFFANLLPALRATRVDPVSALRFER